MKPQWDILRALSLIDKNKQFHQYASICSIVKWGNNCPHFLNWHEDLNSMEKGV